MASTYSSLLRLELLTDGENRGTWGNKTNSNLQTIIEQAIAGISTVVMIFDADYTLTTHNASDDEARKAILNITSIPSLSQTRNVIIPNVSKTYVVKNATTGSQNITIKTATGTGITIQSGCIKSVYCDGTNVYLTDTGNKDYPLLIGSITSANSTRFPNTQVVISNTSVSIQKNEIHNIGLLAEGVAHTSNSSIYGIGVYGVGYTSANTRSGGVVGESHVSASTDVGSAIGVRGYSNDTHSGGLNVGLYGDAAGSSSGNYALYTNNGDIYSANNVTWNFAAGKSLTVSSDVVFSANITVNGTTTTVNSTTVTVDDKNIELASVASPTDATANGGGITLKGTVDKTFNWTGSSNSWISSENIDIASNKKYSIAANTVLSANTLGSGVIYSSLTSTGNVTAGIWNSSIGAVSGANLTSLTANNLVGTIPPSVVGDSSITNSKLANTSVTIGNTAVALGSALTNLSGLSSVTASIFNGSLYGNANTVTNGVYTTDTATVTNTMLFGGITNSKLANTSVTIGNTAVALGSTLTNLSGITGINNLGSTITANGLYSTNIFNGSFSDGIVVDYITGTGRISVGPSDGLKIYNGGVAANTLFAIDANGNTSIGLPATNTKLAVSGPIALQQPSTINAATYTVAANDSSLIFTTLNCTVTMPAAASYPGRILYVKNVTANTVTSSASNIVPLIGGAASTPILLATAGKFAMLQSDGSNWITMMAN